MGVLEFDVTAAYRAWAAGLIFPDRITTALNVRELYGPEVDAACGVEEPAVDEWEAGRLYPTWGQLCALAELTGVTVGFFARAPVSIGAVTMCDRTKRKNGCQVITPRTPILEFTTAAIAAANLPPPPPPPNRPLPPTGRRRRRERRAA